MAFALLLGPLPIAAQPTVLVRAETRIELGTQRGEGRVVLHGALRDDLGSSMADRALQIRLTNAISGEVVIRQSVRTDAEGRFDTVALVTTGDYVLEARFDGDREHREARVSRPIDLDRTDVRLRVAVPNGGALDLDVPSHAIEIRADSVVDGIPQPQSHLEISLFDEHERLLAMGTTDGSGQVRLRVSSADLDELGAGRLKAHSSEDATRAEAQTEVPIVRFRRSELTLGARPTVLHIGGKVLLTGGLGNSRGPLRRKAIGLFADEDVHLATVLTDRDGVFVAEVRIDERDPGTMRIVARFESDTPGRQAAASAPITLMVDSPGGGSWLWAALPVSVCIVFLTLIARRAPQRLTAVPPAPPPPPPGIAPSLRSGRRPERASIRGRVLDRARGTPLRGAGVSLCSDHDEVFRTTDDEGKFSFEEVPRGEHLLRVSARGFAAEETRVSSPHRGEWSDVTVRLDNLRDRILAPYRRIALAFLPSSRLWEIWTNREVLSHARESAIDEAGLENLTHHVETAYYSAEGPTEGDVARVRDEADRTYAGLAGEAPPEAPGEPSR